MAVLVILWILFAGTSAVIATSKNRNALAWGALGLVFGVFALVAVAVMPALPRS